MVFDILLHHLDNGAGPASRILYMVCRSKIKLCHKKYHRIVVPNLGVICLKNCFLNCRERRCSSGLVRKFQSICSDGTPDTLPWPAKGSGFKSQMMTVQIRTKDFITKKQVLTAMGYFARCLFET